MRRRSHSGGFTPNQYLTAYGYDPLHAAGITGGGERVALIEIDGFRYSDVQNFAALLRAPDPGGARVHGRPEQAA